MCLLYLVAYPDKVRDETHQAIKGEENLALKGKVAQLQAMLQEKRARRRARRQARATPYSWHGATARHSSVSSCVSEDSNSTLAVGDEEATDVDDVTGTFTTELPADNDADITAPGVVLA